MQVGFIAGFQNPPQWRRSWREHYAETMELIEFAEELGIDYVWLTEHHFAEDGYSPSVLPLAAHVAARTERIRIGTKALLLPLYHPVRLAEDIATVDQLSGGRFEPGCAAGYRAEEFAGLGVSLKERGRRMEEGLGILRAALTGEPFSFEGECWSVPRAHVVPPPVQRPLPIWAGARTRAGIRRAARHECHFQYADFSAERAREDWEIYAQCHRELGRDPADFRAVSVCTMFLHEDSARAWQLAGPHVLYQQNLYRRWFSLAADRPDDRDRYKPLGSVEELDDAAFLIGDPGECIERIRAFCATVHITDFSFWMHMPGMDPAVSRASLELFAREVLPELRRLGSDWTGRAKSGQEVVA